MKKTTYSDHCPLSDRTQASSGFHGGHPLLSSLGWKHLYCLAHEADFKKKYPTAYKDGHYTPPKYPDPKSTNGVTRIIQNYLTWSGHYANRINVSGRQIGGLVRTEYGNVFDTRKWIKSSTKRGTADLFCSIDGQMVCIEIKNEATKDRTSTHQEKEKARVESAGGIYIVIKSVDEFFNWYNCHANTKQLS
ncbi:MAG TPA: hypothetical protein VD794_07785 [Flavisolibacter sp.]|nr:hypothetical protein [Flavisolibacter sp.]